MKSWKCILGMHKYDKFMGLDSVGNGKFIQRYRCVVCGKTKKVVK
ncbi:MAG: hypothetical protein V1900_03570 [Candidatus Aenigmatarchaeota archaeon]